MKTVLKWQELPGGSFETFNGWDRYVVKSIKSGEGADGSNLSGLAYPWAFKDQGLNENPLFGTKDDLTGDLETIEAELMSASREYWGDAAVFSVVEEATALPSPLLWLGGTLYLFKTHADRCVLDYHQGSGGLGFYLGRIDGELLDELLDAKYKVARAERLLSLNRGRNDGTALPYWQIVTKAGILGRYVPQACGFWFSRDAAKAHLEARSHAYPKTAFVYCESGHNSAHVAELYRLFYKVKP